MIRLAGTLALMTTAFIAGIYIERFTDGGSFITVARKTTEVQMPVFVITGHDTNIEVEPDHAGVRQAPVTIRAPSTRSRR